MIGTFSGGQKSFKRRSTRWKCNQEETRYVHRCARFSFDTKLGISDDKQLGNNSNNYIVRPAGR